MNRNNIYTVNPLYNGSTTQTTEDGSVQSGGTTIIYQQGGGTGLTDAQKQKLDGIQEGAEVNQNAYSKVRLNGSDALIIEAKNKTDILNMSGVYPIAIAINGNGGLDFTVSSDQSNTNSVVTQSQLKAAIDQLEKDKYWKVDADGKLYTELDVYSHKEISAYGAGTGGGGTGGAGALYECADVLRDGDKVKGAEVGSVLSYNGTHWYAIPQSAIVPDLSGYATKSYVSQEINDLIGGAPGTLDTLKEIAEALGNDPNFATTITNMINNIGLRVDDIETRVISLEDMFEWDKSASASDPSLWRIKAKKDLYGVGEISAYGYSSGTVPTGAQYMYELKDVLFTELTSGQLLQWNGTKWINIDKNAVGLNETELAKYLTNNNYAKKSDITWANLLNKPTTWAWTDITGKPTTLAGYGITDAVISSRQILAGNGLTGGGALTSDVTLSLNTIGTAGTYTKITTDQYGRVVSGTILSEGDIPTLQISKISGLQSALDSKLNISDFNTWFTINRDTSGNIVSIQANYNLFSVGEVSAYGLGGTQPSITTLAGLDDVNISNPQNKQALIYDSASGKWINGASVGGGNISLNGTVYKAVDGLITLPNLYEKVAGGTSSQFLKADGSVDGNLYALAYNGNQNKVLESNVSNSLHVIDRRDDTILPSNLEYRTISTFFKAGGNMPDGNWWSGIQVNGWGEGYCAWELAGPSSTNNTAYNLRYRTGIGDTWGDWKTIMTDVECDKNYVKKAGDTMTGNLNVPFILTAGLIAGSLRIEADGEAGEINRTGGHSVDLQRRGTGNVTLCNNGYNTLVGGKIIVDKNRYSFTATPSISLAIGDSDTGLHWQADGIIEFRSNAKQVGYWGYTNGRLFNCYFREPSGVTYEKASLMINGNGSTISPSIGFHQPGVVGCHLELDNWGNFRFKDSSGYRNVYAGNVIAEAGYLYSRYNGIQVAIGANNSSYVHFINNQSKQYYFDNGLAISGTIFPYSDNSYDLGTNSTKWRNIYANRLIGEADKSVFLVTNYIGGQQANPQTYFNNGIGIKVAMTGSIQYWNDTLWINGYSGGDVKNMCALHTMRNGTPEMYISTQLSDATAYGTMYRFWTSYNSNHSSADWVCKGLSAHARIETTADIYSAGWLRTVGQTGWYSESYGGGWYMTDSTWIRAFGNKQIYTASTSPDAFHTLGGVNASGRIYAGSYIETHGGLVCAGVGNSGGASGFNVYASFYGNGQHGGIEIGASDNVFGIGVHSNDHMYWWWTNSGSVGSSSNKSYIMDYGGGSWNFTGSVVASGEVTAYSDARLKSNIHTLDYRGRLIPRHYVKDGKQSIGFIAQEVQALYPELVLGYDKSRPYLSLNYNGCTAVLSAQLNHVEDEVTMLKNKVRELEIKVSVLTEQLHSQAI